MKYIFIVQGEGRGHLTQALSLKNILEKRGHEVLQILVGISGHRKLPKFFVEKANTSITLFESPNFLPTAENKRSKIFRSIIYNIKHITAFLNMMWYIRDCINKSDADVVINFYELLAGLTNGILRPSKPMICIGHQYLFLHKDYCFPSLFRGNLMLLKFFTRLTSLRCQKRLALSFTEMENDDKSRITVVPPLLRPEVLRLKPTEDNYFLGYMVNNGFASEIYEFHAKHPEINMHFFWDKKGAGERMQLNRTLTFHQVNDELFLEKMRCCKGYATTAGFESVCESIFLGKPVMMVPAHIEQDCNAFEAQQIGAGIISSHFDLKNLIEFSACYKPNTKFRTWVRKAEFRIMPQLQPQERVADWRVTDHLRLAWDKLHIRITY